MRWWDRFIDWFVAGSDRPVAGPGAPATPPWVLSEADRAWLREAADSLDGASRTTESVLTGEAAVTIVLTDAFARQISARLRAIAG